MAEVFYPFSAFPEGVDAGLLGDQITAAGITPIVQGVTATTNVIINLSAPPDAADQATIDGVVAAHAPALLNAKTTKNFAIDQRTRELIEQGFEHPAASGDYFSLSANAQRSITMADLKRSDPTFVYPRIFNTLDNAATISLANAAALHNFALAAHDTIRAQLDSGTALKDQVRAATTIVEVNTAIDNRS